MNLLNSTRDLSKDVGSIKSISEKIDKKLFQLKLSDDKIDKLTLEELQDLRKIVGLADFMIQKYEDKKETRSILQHFVSIIFETAQSMDGLDDEISELIISAEDSINKVKDLHSHISEKSDLKHAYEEKTGSINLTNIPTEINTVEYQQNSQGDNA